MVVRDKDDGADRLLMSIVWLMFAGHLQDGGNSHEDAR